MPVCYPMLGAAGHASLGRARYAADLAEPDSPFLAVPIPARIDIGEGRRTDEHHLTLVLRILSGAVFWSLFVLLLLRFS